MDVNQQQFSLEACVMAIITSLAKRVLHLKCAEMVRSIKCSFHLCFTESGTVE